VELTADKLKVKPKKVKDKPKPLTLLDNERTRLVDDLD